mgnify:FL=1
MTIKLVVKGISAALKRNDVRSKALRAAWPRAIHRTLTDVFERVQAAFESSGPGWKPLAARTLAWKRKHGYSSKPLIRRGAFRQGWDIAVSGTKGRLKSHVNYGAYHQAGTRHLPKRPVVPKDATLRQILRFHVRAFVQGAL